MKNQYDSWKSVSVVRITQGKNKGKDRINIIFYCPKCDGDILISGIVPLITRKSIYFNFPSQGKCQHCGKYANVNVPGKPTRRWKELAEQEIRDCLWEDTHRYIIHTSSGNSSKKKRQSKDEIKERRQKRYGGILKATSESVKRKIA